jgi:hypothetical protein
MTMMASHPQPLPLAQPPAAFGDTTLTKVFVGGLAWETHEGALRGHFQRYGDILEAVIISDKLTGRSKGYGFVSPSPLSSPSPIRLPAGFLSRLVRDVMSHIYTLLHARDATGDVQGGGRSQEGVRGCHPRHQRPSRQLQPRLPRRQAEAPAAAARPPSLAPARARARASLSSPAHARYVRTCT